MLVYSSLYFHSVQVKEGGGFFLKHIPAVQFVVSG